MSLSKIAILSIFFMTLPACHSLQKNYTKKERIFQTKTGFYPEWECSSLPVHIIYDQELEYKKVKAIFDVVSYINKSLGFKIFHKPTILNEINKNYKINTIFIKKDKIDLPSNKAGRALIKFDNEFKQYFIYATILINKDMSDYQSYYDILVHEFGHTLGLNHSNDKCSVMYKNLYSRNCLGKVNYYYQYDINILKRIYRKCF